MRFEGEFAVAAPPERVWAALLDVEALAACLPGAGDARRIGPNRYAGALKVKLGPIAASFELTGDLDARPDEGRCAVDVRGRERLTGTVVQARFETRLSPEPDGTRVAYGLDVSLLGKLGQMGQAVFQDVARKMTDQTVGCLKRRIEAGG